MTYKLGAGVSLSEIEYVLEKNVLPILRSSPGCVEVQLLMELKGENAYGGEVVWDTWEAHEQAFEQGGVQLKSALTQLFALITEFHETHYRIVNSL